MHALGFQSIELEGIRKEHLMLIYEKKEEIKNKIDHLNLNIPFFCVVLPGLSSADRKERQENLELFKKGCEIAETLGSKAVLDNAPLPPYRFPQNIPVVRHYDDETLTMANLPDNLNWSYYWDQLIDTYRTACDIAADYNLTYQMHPCLGVLSSTTDGFLQFFDAVKRDNLRFNLDTANQFMMKDNLFLSLHRLKDHIDYIHLSDNRGYKVEHLQPEKGAIRWDIFFETLEKINYKGYIGLDIGGAESDIDDLDAAYQNTRKWLQKHWK
jgi:sugar phosphate isomerase/epimerase